MSMEDKRTSPVWKSTSNLYDGSNPRKKKKKTKPSLLNGDHRVMDEMHQDILERVLAQLPVSSFFQFRSVCKRWNSLTCSPSFLKACSEVSRGPWFYMVDSKDDKSIVYDTEVSKWHHIRYPCELNKSMGSKPVASAGGLICFRSSCGYFTVCNPLTAHCNVLPLVETRETIHAIVMVAYQKSYKVIVTYGEMPGFVVKVYDSSKQCWSEPSINWNKEERKSGKPSLKQNIVSTDDETVYFLNKGGNVVARDMRRNPSKEFSSILTSSQNGEEIIYFLNRGGKVVSCNMQKGIWNEFPSLLPSTSEYSVDLVDCGGRMLVVVLHEMMENATVRIWEFDETKGEWVHVLAMPPAISHEYFGKKADINCVGYDNLIMICLSSHRFDRVVLCDIVKDSWLELPRYYVPGIGKVKQKKFVSAFSFEPRLEALV